MNNAELENSVASLANQMATLHSMATTNAVHMRHIADRADKFHQREHPDCWTAVSISVENNDIFEVQAWLRETAPGRYDVVSDWKAATFYFENRADAVAFKLRWGGAA